MNENLKKYLNAYGDEMITAMKKALKEAGKGNSRLINSLAYKLKMDEDDIDIEFIMEEYSNWVDKGRGPGKQPPLNIIQEWANRKGLPAKSAYPIARNIGLFGLPATNFLDPLRQSKQKMLDGISKAVAKDIADNIRKNNKTK